MTSDLYKNRCTALLKLGFNYSDLNNYNNFKDILSKTEFDNEIRLKQNRKNKRNRTKRALMDLVRFYQLVRSGTKHLVFGTCTLDNNSLRLKPETIDKKINYWLKQHFMWSIVNIDYGKKNERKHYHFIGLTTELIEDKHIKSKKGHPMFELQNKTYEMGWEPDLLIVDFNKNDIDKTINYLLKLNNHSNKSTTSSRVRIIKQEITKYSTKEKGKINTLG